MIMDVATKIATKKQDITETGKNICTATSNLQFFRVKIYLDMALSSITFHLWTRHINCLSWEELPHLERLTSWLNSVGYIRAAFLTHRTGVWMSLQHACIR